MSSIPALVIVIVAIVVTAATVKPVRHTIRENVRRRRGWSWRS